jgi:hypothetical protein
VKVLEGLTVTAFNDQPEVLAAWESARNLYGPITRSAGSTEPTAEAEGTNSPASEGLEDAA